MTQRQTTGRVEGKVALVTGAESSTTPDGRDGRQARTRKVAPTPPGPRSTIRTATGGSSKRSRRGSPVGNRKGVAATLSVKEVRHVVPR